MQKQRWMAVAAGLVLSAATAAAQAKTELTWWGHAAFVLRTPGGAVLAVDPWFENPVAPKGKAWPDQVDAILVSHGHADHVGNTIALATKTGAQVIGSHELVRLMGVAKGSGGNAGGSFRVKDVTIHLVEAVHSSGYGTDAKAPLQYGGAPLGFVIAVDKGPTLYHAGDTGLFSSMSLIAEQYQPTVALLPIGGNYTLDPAGAALALKLLRVRTVVPMHFGTFPLLAGTPAQLKEAVRKAKGKAQVLELTPGQSTSL